MKTIYCIVCVLFMGGLGNAQVAIQNQNLPKGSQYVWSGKGTQLVATTNAQVYTLPQTNYAFGIYLHNEGTNKTFFGYGNTASGFNPAQAESIAGGTMFNSDAAFNMLIGRKITSVIYQTTNGTSLINVSFE